MNWKNQKTLEALKKAKQAVDLANNALDCAIQELDAEALDKVTGAGELDDAPYVDIYRYDPEDSSKY